MVKTRFSGFGHFLSSRWAATAGTSIPLLCPTTANGAGARLRPLLLRAECDTLPKISASAQHALCDGAHSHVLRRCNQAGVTFHMQPRPINLLQLPEDTPTGSIILENAQHRKQVRLNNCRAKRASERTQLRVLRTLAFES